MKRVKMIPLLNIVAIVSIAMIVSCSDSGSDPDPNPPPPPPGGDVTITSVSDGDNFWGEELTITGTGFSTTKENNIVKFLSVQPPVSCTLNYTSAGGDIEIISATATQIKIKIPVKIINDIPYCGPEKASIEVTVGDKKAKIDNVQFYGLPYVDSFLYHYGWFDIPSVTRIGDSVMIAGGMRGAYARDSKYWDDIRLTINSQEIPIKFRSIGLESGWSFFMDVKDFGEVNCDTDPDDWGAREMEFEFSIAGTGKKSGKKKLFVQYLPTQSAQCVNCPQLASKTGDDVVWEIEGSNIYAHEVRYASTNCGGPEQHVGLSPVPHFSDHTAFTIPVSMLSANCSYSITLMDACGGGQLMGFVTITP